MSIANPIITSPGLISAPESYSLDGGRYFASWLLSEFSSNTWIVTGIEHKPNVTIKFDVRLPNGSRLADYPHLIDTIKRIVFGLRSGPLAKAEGANTQYVEATNLIVLARWMISRDITSFKDLTPTDVREYAELAIFGSHTIVNAEAVLLKHLESLILQAGFDDRDSPKERRAKAMQQFPYSNIGEAASVLLDRTSLLNGAGLEGLGSTGTLTQMLDEIESTCGYYLSPRVRERMKREEITESNEETPLGLFSFQRLLLPFKHIYDHRRYLNDAASRKLYPAKWALADIVSSTKSIGRTRTIPVAQAATLIERSIRWVLDYAPSLLLLQAGENVETSHLIGAVGSPFPLISGFLREKPNGSSNVEEFAINLRQGMALPSAITFLITACAIVIASFTARRASEIIGLKTGCIRHDEQGKPWLEIFIHKTLQGLTVIPVPEVVEAAINVLEALSAKSRSITGTPYLFQYTIPGIERSLGLNAEGVPIFTLSNHVRRFGYFIDVPPLPDGTRWAFSPHQFRRFFAILYIWIYELGEWEVLSQHLRHFSLEKTRRYVTDPELGHIIALVKRTHTAQILASAALGKVRVNGTEGTRFASAAKRIYDRLSQRIQVVPERKLIQRVTRLIDLTGVELHALPWGYCVTLPNTEEGHCVCTPSGNQPPNYGAATFSKCKNCVFGTGTTAFLPYLQSSLKFHDEIVNSEATPIIMKRASFVISRDIRQYLSDVDLSLLG